MKIATVVGIRPDFIRMSEIIRLLDRQKGIEHLLVHSGQHYSPTMDKVFFDELGIRKPDVNCEVGSGTHGEQAARVILATEKVFAKEKPDLCIYLGDANPTLSALAAAKMNIKIAHIEGGMRSFDWRMPEEKNRTIVDHLSDYVYVYTQWYKEHLLFEGIPSHKVFVVGNPIVDIVEKYRKPAAKSAILKKMKLRKRQYVLVTLHREENVDDPKVLASVCEAMARISKKLGMPVYFPMSFRTQKRLQTFGIKLDPAILTSDPLGFLDFLCLEENAGIVVTDSGTVQEETAILRVPCVVARTSTERPETIEAGATILAGTKADDLVAAAAALIDRPRTWNHGLGDGKTSERIVDHLVRMESEIMDKSMAFPLIDRRRQYAYSEAAKVPDAKGGGWSRPKPSPVRWD